MKREKIFKGKDSDIYIWILENGNAWMGQNEPQEDEKGKPLALILKWATFPVERISETFDYDLLDPNSADFLKSSSQIA